MRWVPSAARLILMKTTADMKISARILVLVQTGMPLPAAVDAVLGVGTYAKLAGDVYDALKAK